MSALGFKARADPSLACFVACMNGFFRFTSCVTPADHLAASIAAEQSLTYVYVCKHFKLDYGKISNLIYDSLSLFKKWMARLMGATLEKAGAPPKNDYEN